MTKFSRSARPTATSRVIARVARQQRLAVRGVTQDARLGRLDGGAVDAIEEDGDLADQRAGAGDRVDHDRALAHPQGAGDQDPQRAGRAAFLDDDLAGRELDAGKRGRKRQHVVHREHRKRA